MSDPFRAFVERVARLTLPRDPEELQKWRDALEADAGTPDEDVLDDLPSDLMEDEASALWRLIEEARELLK
jgi:hypothetical protein